MNTRLFFYLNHINTTNCGKFSKMFFIHRLVSYVLPSSLVFTDDSDDVSGRTTISNGRAGHMRSADSLTLPPTTARLR